MDSITKRLCFLIDHDIERRLKSTLGYSVEDDEYPAYTVSSKEILELYDTVSEYFIPSSKVVSFFDFGSGIGNLMLLFYNAAVADDYTNVKVIGIEKYTSIIGEAKKLLNHSHLPKNNYLFYRKDLKEDLDIFFHLLHKTSIGTTKFDQNVVFCNRLFKNSEPQARLEKAIVDLYPKGTIFIFYMPVYCTGKSTKEYAELGLQQITHQIFIKTK